MIAQIERLVADGLHPCAASIERVGSDWTSSIMLDDWADTAELGDTLAHHVVTLDRSKIPDGVSVSDNSRWPPDVIPLARMSDEVAEAMIGEIARLGLAPDWAAFAVPGKRPHHWLTKPIIWMREPLRTALLRKYGHGANAGAYK